MAEIRAARQKMQAEGRQASAFRTDYFAAGAKPPLAEATAAPVPFVFSQAQAEGRPEVDRVKQLVAEQGQEAPALQGPSRPGIRVPQEPEKIQRAREGAEVIQAVSSGFLETATAGAIKPLLKAVEPEIEKIQEKHGFATSAGGLVGFVPAVGLTTALAAKIPGFVKLPSVVQDVLSGYIYGTAEHPLDPLEAGKVGLEFGAFGAGFQVAGKALPTIARAAETFVGPRLGEPFPEAVKVARSNAVQFVGRKKGTLPSGGNPPKPGAYIFHDPVTKKMVTVDNLPDLPQAVAAKRALYERGKMGEKGPVEPIEPGRELGKSEEAAFPELRTPKVAPRPGIGEEAKTILDRPLTPEERLAAQEGGQVGRAFEGELAVPGPEYTTKPPRRPEEEAQIEADIKAGRQTPEGQAEAKDLEWEIRRQEREADLAMQRQFARSQYPDVAAIAERLGLRLDGYVEVKGKRSFQFSETPESRVISTSGHPATINTNLGEEVTLEGLKKHILRSREGFAKEGKASEIALTGEAPVTPTDAVSQIIEGKAESKIGMADFKKQMLGKLDEAIAKAPAETPEGAGQITISIPGDGEFTILNRKAELEAVRQKVNAIKPGEFPPARKREPKLSDLPKAPRKEAWNGNRLQPGALMSDGRILVKTEALEKHQTFFERKADVGARDIEQTKDQEIFDKHVQGASRESGLPVTIHEPDVQIGKTVLVPRDAKSLNDVIVVPTEQLRALRNATNFDTIRLTNESAVLFKNGEPVGVVMALKGTDLKAYGTIAAFRERAGFPKPKPQKKRGGPAADMAFEEPPRLGEAAAPGGRFNTSMPPRQGAPPPPPPGVSLKVAKILRRPIVSAQDIVNYVQDALNKPAVRIGKQFRGRPGVRGLFFPREQSVWMKSIDNFPTLSHEIAHNIDNQVLGTSRSIASGKLIGGAPKGKRVARHFGKDDAVIRKELKDLDYDPKQRRVEEGFAEYMRYRLTSDLEAPALAPKFHEWFNTEFLPTNPQLAQVVHDTRELIRRFQDDGAAARMHSWIDRSKGPLEKWRDLDVRDWVSDRVSRFMSLWVDDIYPLEQIEKRMVGGGQLAVPEASPTQIARAVKSSDQATARHFVDEGAVNFLGQDVGPGLRQILEPFGREEVVAPGGLMDCLVSKVVVQRAQNGQSFTGYRVEDAQWVVDNILSQRPDYQLALEQITKWGDNLMLYLKDAGGLSEAAYLRIKANNEFWVPLMRVYAEGPGRGIYGGGGRGYGNVGVPIKGAKGGEGRPIIDPLESLVDYARQIISASNRVRVGRALVNLAKQKEGVGKYIQEVQPPMRPVEFQAERIKREMLKIAEKHGIEIEIEDPEILKETWDEILTIYLNAPRYSGLDNVITIMEKGRPKYYEVDKDIYRAFEGLDNFTLPPSLDWIFGRMTRGVRLGATGLNLGFQGTNVIRDVQTFSIQSQYSHEGLLGPKMELIPFGGLDPVARAFMEEMRGSASFERFKAAGLEMSGQVGSDRRSFKRVVDGLLADTKARKALNVVNHPIDITREMLAIFENAPRYAEFKAGEAKFGAATERSRIASTLAAREVTTNFQRAGYYGRWANQMIPFFNPAVQGISKWGRALFENPRMTMFKVGTNITLPSVAIWLMNKDEPWYKQLPAWDRWGFMHFPVGTEADGTPRILRLPRPFEWGYVFGADVTAALDVMYNEDPDALKEALKQTVGQFTPPLLPTLFQVPVEVATNFDLWKMKPIVPYGLQKYWDPEDQYFENTTDFAIQLGKVLGVSPLKIEHVIKSYTGGLGMEALRVAENGADYMGILPDDANAQAPEWPIIGRFFSRAEDEISALRSRRLEELLQRARERNKLRGRNRKPEGLSPNTPRPALPPKISRPPKPVVR